MFESVILTVISDDRPGIVKQLSLLIENHGGNWTESSMLSLAGKFAGILQASIPTENRHQLIQELRALESEGMQVLVQASSHQHEPAVRREFTLELLGQDRPGIVHDITDILARHGVNVQELETSIESASMSGESLFRARARLLVPEGVHRAVLREELEDLANELMVDINLQD